MNYRFWKNKRVLITGINGFVGGNLAKELIKDGAHVYGLVRNLNQDSFLFYEGLDKNVNIINGNIIDYQLLKNLFSEENIEICFHLAAQVEVGVAKEYPLLTWETNVRGTYTLLEAIRENAKNIQSVIIASSDKSYGPYPPEAMPYMEEYPLQPIYPYDTSKACADFIAQSYAKGIFNIPTIITRFANIYGPGQLNFSALIPDCIRSALGYSEFIPRSDGSHIRDFLFVSDVSELYKILAMELSKNKGFSGEIFNAGTNTAHKVKDIVNKVYEILNNKSDLKIIEKQFKNNKTIGEIDIQYMNYEKLLNNFNWSPKTNFNSGLDTTIKWYEKYLKS